MADSAYAYAKPPRAVRSRKLFWLGASILVLALLFVLFTALQLAFTKPVPVTSPPNTQSR